MHSLRLASPARRGLTPEKPQKPVERDALLAGRPAARGEIVG
jgi:hypothetical protein